MPRRIENDGPSGAPLLVVGRDPGGVEEAEGKPFVGPAGGILNAAMKRAGLSRSRALFTNVVKVRPPLDEWERHDARDVNAGVAELGALLKAEKPQLVVACGEQALLACLGFNPLTDSLEEDARLDTITNLRGYRFTGLYGHSVLAMVHPADITPYAVVPLGRPARALGRPSRRPLSEISHYDSWGQGDRSP